MDIKFANGWTGEVDIAPEAGLSGAILDYYNLDHVNLNGAKLDCASLVHANLSGAKLFEANLDNSNLREANLSGADLFGTSLRTANLRGTNLRGTNLNSANLSYSDLCGADLYGANLDDANLHAVNGIIVVEGYLPYRLVVSSYCIHIGCRSKTLKEWQQFAIEHEECEFDHFRIAKTRVLLETLGVFTHEPRKIKML